MRDDLKVAWRALRASRTFTAVALIVLTLGIGASTAIFSVVDAVVLRALPFDEHDRLVAVGERRQERTARPERDAQALLTLAPQNYLDLAARQQVFTALAAVVTIAATLQPPGGEPEDLRAQRVTASFFDVLRMRPALGRAFTADSEVDGRHRVAVLSDALWRRRFGADPAIVGRTIPLSDGAFEVIGVMPPGVTYPVGAARATDLWMPYVVPADERIRIEGQVSLYLQTIARLKPDMTVERAQAQLTQVAAALERTHPVWNKAVGFGVRPLRDHLVGARVTSWLLMLLGAVGLVLLIACANVANLLLARATTREREMSLRAALGAGRGRLVRQLVVESVMLSSVATLLAITAAWWLVALLKSAMPEGIPRVSTIALDLRVLTVAAALSLLTGLLFGLVPALRLSKPDLMRILKRDSGGSVGGGRQGLRHTLVVAEVALAVVLLVGAALFLGSFVTLVRIDPGFDPAQVLIVQVSPRFEPGRPRHDFREAYAQLVERVGQAPGVVHASMILGGTPLSGSMSTTTLAVPGAPEPRENEVSFRRVTPDYFKAFRIPLLRGRAFAPTDRGSPPVVILNDSAARTFFPGADPIGRPVLINRAAHTVVGVAGDVHQTSLETEPRTEAYVPVAFGAQNAGELVIRTSGHPEAVVPAVKAAMLQVLPDVPIRNVRTMETVVSRLMAQRRLNMVLVGVFGVLGLVMSAAGLYGVMAFAVSQRTREIGIRMALGASRAQVMRMVLLKASVLVGAGLIAGGAAAWSLSATTTKFLFGLNGHDPRAYAAALLTLSVAALVASAVPARRAASVDPLVAWRSE